MGQGLAGHIQIVQIKQAYQAKGEYSQLSSFLYFWSGAMKAFTSFCKSSTTITPPSIASSSLRSFSTLVLVPLSLRHQHATKLSAPYLTKSNTRRISITQLSKMSQKTFSNTEVPADKPADPYKATNKTEPELKEKVEDLVKFIESCKFGMMTTRIESSGLLTSRCMALAAKVFHCCPSPMVLYPLYVQELMCSTTTGRGRR